MKPFRDLRADEIEVRVAMSKDNGCQLLLYKNARVDMQILDETLGAENWSREHYEINGVLFCRVGIKCGDEWVYKSDCGTDSNTEPEKGRSSDSFKRACTNWGIGRELYTAPFIWVPAGNYKTGAGGRVNDRFLVSHIEIDDKKIIALEVQNSALKTVFSMKPTRDTTETKKPTRRNFAACAVCGAKVGEKMAAASRAKYGAVYCSKKCFDERKIEE